MPLPAYSRPSPSLEIWHSECKDPIHWVRVSVPPVSQSPQLFLNFPLQASLLGRQCPTSTNRSPPPPNYQVCPRKFCNVELYSSDAAQDNSSYSVWPRHVQPMGHRLFMSSLVPSCSIHINQECPFHMTHLHHTTQCICTPGLASNSGP